MYHDRSHVRDIAKRVYFSEHEMSEIDEAVEATGRERASFLRDAALVVARFIKRQEPGSEVSAMNNINQHLSSRVAANDENHIKYLLAQ